MNNEMKNIKTERKLEYANKTYLRITTRINDELSFYQWYTSDRKEVKPEHAERLEKIYQQKNK